MPSNTPQSKRFRLLLLILALLVVVATVWIVDQKQDLQKLQEGDFRITYGMVQELIIEIDSYSEFHDPALLGQIYVRFRYLDVQTQRMITYREKPVSIAYPTTAASVTHEMIKSNLPPEKITTHLERYKETLVQYRDRNVPHTDVEQHQADLIAMWAQLCETSFLNSREMSSP